MMSQTKGRGMNLQHLYEPNGLWKFCTDGSYAKNGGKGPLVGVIMEYSGELLILLLPLLVN
jgi:hypothetical protein